MAWTKLPTFRRRHFQFLFLIRTFIFGSNFIEVILGGTVDNRSALAQVMTKWVPIMAKLYEAIGRRWAMMSLWKCYSIWLPNAPSHWETSLQCNDDSHWLGTYIDWSLKEAQIRACNYKLGARHQQTSKIMYGTSSVIANQVFLHNAVEFSFTNQRLYVLVCCNVFSSTPIDLSHQPWYCTS